MRLLPSLLALAALAALAALVFAGSALAQPRVLAGLPPQAVVVSPGERVVLSAAAGDPVVESRGLAPDGDLAAQSKLDNSYEQIGTVALKAPVSPALPGQLVLELSSDPKNGARLVAQDGANYPVIYTAVLVLQRGDQRRYVSTSICPVRPGHPGLESWGDDVAGVAITAVQRVDPDHMACNDGSLLAVQAQPDAQQYACSGGEPGEGPLPAFQVTLVVDADGKVSRESATWVLARADMLHSPAVGFDYAMEGDRLTPGARDARVMAVVSLQPKPQSRSADVVLLFNGVEVARRPWRMFATNMAAQPPPPQAGGTPAAFFGVIPIFPVGDPATDAALSRLLASAGREPGMLEVRVVGDTGEVIADGSYEVSPSTPISDPSRVSAAAHKAEVAAKTPTQCRMIKP